LHVRYNREKFPQDLMFQVTPNTENYQARYVITHPATGDFSCEAGKKYLKELKQRRAEEMEMLTYLTGKGYSDWDVVVNEPEEKFIPTDASYAAIAPNVQYGTKGNNGIFFAALGVLGIITIAGFSRKKKDS
jgi:hypothetical protein